MTRRSLAAAVLVLVAAAPVAAGEPTDRLRTFIERANRVILAPEADGGLDERVSAVRALVTEVFDFEGAAALALGRHWASLPPPARVAFTRLYADVVERGYLAWVGSKARVGEGGVSIRWLEERVEPDAATVTSVLLTRTGTELPIDYRMVRRDERWLVRDVVMDGVSLAANYHVQFERVMQLGSYDELLARLHDKAGPAARAAAAAVVMTPAPIVIAELSETPSIVASDASPRTLSPPPLAAADTVAAIRTVTPPPLPPAVASVSAVVKTSPPSEAPAPRAPGVAPAARPVFWVQVGAFRTVDAAIHVVQRLRQYAVTIAVGGDRRAPLTRVLVGPFTEHAAAASTMRTLRASGIAAFIAGSPD